jgi:hypothetical protein
VPSLRLRQKAINLAQTDDGLFKVNDVLKFTVYVLTVYKHSWVQRRAGPKVPASARSPSAAVMTTQTYAPWRRENVNT